MSSPLGQVRQGKDGEIQLYKLVNEMRRYDYVAPGLSWTIAQESIGAFKCVARDPSTENVILARADSTNYAVGVIEVAVNVGELAKVVHVGVVLNAVSGRTAGDVCWVGPDGSLVFAPPGVGNYVEPIAVCMNATDIFVSVGGAPGSPSAPALARYWLSIADTQLPNGVDMGALGPGVIQQTVSGGISTPTAFATTDQRILFGTTTGQLADDYRLGWSPGNATLTVFGLTQTTTLIVGAGAAFPNSRAMVTADVGVNNGTLSIRNENAGNYFARLGFSNNVGNASGTSILMPSTTYSGGEAYEPDSLTFAHYGNFVFVGSGAPVPFLLEIFQDGKAQWINSSAAVSSAGAAAIRAHGNKLQYSQNTGPWTDFDAAALSAITSLTTDVVATGPGAAVATIQPHVVSYAKMQQASAHVLLGNPTGSTADVSEITLGSGLAFSGTTLTATGSGGTVTSVTATLPLTSSGGTTPDIALNYDNVSLNLTAGTTLRRAALTGDITAAAGSNTTAFRNGGALSVLGRSANSSGSIADISAASNGDVLRVAGSVLGFGAIPVASVTGAVPDTRTLSATSPIRIDGGASADLSANRTISIQGAIVSGSTSTTAQNLGALTTGLLKGTVAAGVSTISTAAAGTDYQGVITWPAVNQLLFSTGTTTVPTGDPGLTWDNGSNAVNFSSGDSLALYNLGSAEADTNYERLAIFRSSNVYHITSQNKGTGTIRTIYISSVRTGNAASGVTIDDQLLVNGVTGYTNASFVVGATTNSDRDKAKFFVGGGTVPDSPDNTLLGVFPINTTVPAGVASGVWSTARITNLTYTGVSSPTLTEATSLYVDGAPTLSGVSGSAYAVHVGGGETRLDGKLTVVSAGAGYSLGSTSVAVVAETGGTGHDLTITGNGTDGQLIGSSWKAITFFATTNSGFSAEYVRPGAEVTGSPQVASAAPGGTTSIRLGSGVTFSGTTAVATWHGVSIPRPTYIGGTVTVTDAASLYIENSPLPGAGITITNPYAVWIDNGVLRYDGAIALGGGAAPTLGTIGGSGPTTAAQNKWIKINADGTSYFIPLWI